MVFLLFLQKDDVEYRFGRQRFIGQRCDNKIVRHFGNNDNSINLQYLIRVIAGNVQECRGMFQNLLRKFYEIFPENFSTKNR